MEIKVVIEVLTGVEFFSDFIDYHYFILKSMRYNFALYVVSKPYLDTYANFFVI